MSCVGAAGRGNTLRSVIRQTRYVVPLVRVVVPTLLALLVGACGGRDSTQGPFPGGTIPTSATGAPPATEGSGVTLPTTSPPPTSSTTTLPPRGLPEHHPVPANGIMTLGGDSTLVQSLTIRGVPMAEVHDWFVGGLLDSGYVILNDQPTHVEFAGTGIFGTSDLTKGDGEVQVVFVLGAPIG